MFALICQIDIEPVHWLDYVFYSNKVSNYLWCAGLLLAAFLFKKYISVILSKVVYAFIKRYSDNVSTKRFVELLAKPYELLLLIILIYTAFSFLKYPEEWNLADRSELGVRLVVLKTYQIVITMSILWVILRSVDFAAIVWTRRAQRSDLYNEQLVPYLRELVKILLCIMYFFFVLGAIFKLDIASIIAGLGIGGLAVALAGKETLENLLASFTIFLDKPFQVGDAVKLDTIEGEIERIGFRSTRIRTFDKSFLTIPNRMLVDKPVDNLTYRTLRRGRYKVYIEYNTPNDVLLKIQKEILDYLKHYEHCNGECYAVFDNFGAFGIELLIVYYVKTNLWEVFLEHKDIINFSIKHIIERNGAKLSYIRDIDFLDDKF